MLKSLTAVQQPTKSLACLRCICTRTYSANGGPINPSKSELEELGITTEDYNQSINRVSLIGRVGWDPGHHGTSQYHCLVFPLATHEPLKNVTDWHRIIVMDPYIKNYLAHALKKGDKCMVEGSIIYQTIHDKHHHEGPRTVETTSILADKAIVLQKVVEETIKSTKSKTKVGEETIKSTKSKKKVGEETIKSTKSK